MKIIAFFLVNALIYAHTAEISKPTGEEFMKAYNTLIAASDLATKINANVFNQNHPPGTADRIMDKKISRVGPKQGQIFEGQREKLNQDLANQVHTDTVAVRVDSKNNVFITVNTRTRSDHKNGQTQFISKPNELGISRKNHFMILDTVRNDPRFAKSEVTIIQPVMPPSNHFDNAKPHAEIQLLADAERTPISPTIAGRKRGNTLESANPPPITFIRKTSLTEAYKVNSQNSPPSITLKIRSGSTAGIKESSPPKITFLNKKQTGMGANPSSNSLNPHRITHLGSQSESNPTAGRTRSKSVGSAPNPINTDMIIGTSKAACGKCTEELQKKNAPHNNADGLPKAKVTNWEESSNVPALTKITFTAPNSRRNSVASIQITPTIKPVSGTRPTPLSRRGSISSAIGSQAFSADRKKSTGNISQTKNRQRGS